MTPGPAEYGRLARYKPTGERVRVMEVADGKVSVWRGGYSRYVVTLADFDKDWELLPEMVGPVGFVIADSVPAPPVDHRALLVKVIRNSDDGWLGARRHHYAADAFTDAEWAELQRLAGEAQR